MGFVLYRIRRPREYRRWLTDYMKVLHTTYASKKIKDRNNEKEETIR
jgi:hypothetical protein